MKNRSMFCVNTQFHYSTVVENIVEKNILMWQHQGKEREKMTNLITRDD